MERFRYWYDLGSFFKDSGVKLVDLWQLFRNVLDVAYHSAFTAPSKTVVSNWLLHMPDITVKTV